jgi:hypothetical protein
VTGVTSAGHGSEAVRVARRWILLSLAMAACGGRLDAGWDEPKGMLPVDDRNPIVLCNDGPHDNWQGEYAMLLSSTGGPRLAGIVINDSWPWPDLDDNMAGWRQMVDAAREGGLRDIPDPLASTGPVLVRPSDGNIDSTVPNRSEGARFIIDASQRLSLPYRPLVVVTGGRLTDVADAYLMDHTLPGRIVVVSSLGTPTTDGGEMGVPNGEMDTWADVIVAQKFRYVQVSAFYDQKTDVTASLLSELPTNAFTSWIESKEPEVWDDLVAADQVGVLAVAIPSYVSAVVRAVQQGVGADDMPALSSDPGGPVWLVTEVSGAVGTARFWQMLLDATTFSPD